MPVKTAMKPKYALRHIDEILREKRFIFLMSQMILHMHSPANGLVKKLISELSLVIIVCKLNSAITSPSISSISRIVYKHTSTDKYQ